MLLRAASFLGLLAALSACDPVDTGNRRCPSSIPATVVDTAKNCGVRQLREFEICETPPATTCASQQPTFVCLATPGGTGVLVELSPCATLATVPNGWALGESNTNGFEPARDCKIARSLCDGSSLPYVAPGESPPTP